VIVRTAGEGTEIRPFYGETDVLLISKPDVRAC